MTASALFLAHGSPANAVDDNPFTKALQSFGEKTEKPDAIVIFSAHWRTKGIKISSCNRQIYDFYGFDDALYRVQYQPPVAKRAIERIHSLVGEAEETDDWGLDHGVWSPLSRLFPQADVPVVQISLDADKTPQELMEL